MVCLSHCILLLQMFWSENEEVLKRLLEMHEYTDGCKEKSTIEILGKIDCLLKPVCINYYLGTCEGSQDSNPQSCPVFPWLVDRGQPLVCLVGG